MKISRELQAWFLSHARSLPWRETNDPYRIWLSEIMLQQTRVDQALPYYERFLRRFPRVHDLANASRDEVFALWEGLGYYRRAAHLHRTAQIVSREMNGQFPATAKELEKLPGIGPYTAAAVASFAFGEPVAVLDGNVSRVLARLTGESLPVNSNEGQKRFRQLAFHLLDPQNPALHNQAIMELGALVCTPQNPRCDLCPLQRHCRARHQGIQNELPVKIKKKPVKNRYLHYIYAANGHQVNLQQRRDKDIWQGLYEFPLLETPRRPGKSFRKNLENRFGLPEHSLRLIKTQTHLLTHRKLHLYFWQSESLLPDYPAVPLRQAARLAMPVPLKRFLENQINNHNFEN